MTRRRGIGDGRSERNGSVTDNSVRRGAAVMSTASGLGRWRAYHEWRRRRRASLHKPQPRFDNSTADGRLALDTMLGSGWIGGRHLVPELNCAACSTETTRRPATASQATHVTGPRQPRRGQRSCVSTNISLRAASELKEVTRLSGADLRFVVQRPPRTPSQSVPAHVATDV